MSKVQILEELPKLTPEERQEVRAKLNEIEGRVESEWLDEDDPLTDADKALIEGRLVEHEKHPETSIPWSDFDARLKRRLGS